MSFLSQEVDAGIIFVERAKRHREAGSATEYETSTQNAFSVLRVIDRAKGRLPTALRVEIDCGRAELFKKISELKACKPPVNTIREAKMVSEAEMGVPVPKRCVAPSRD